MAAGHGASALISFIIAAMILAGMQAFRSQLAHGQAMTIFGGFLGSNMFVFLLTFVSNLEMEVFGSSFQTKLVPEVVSCLAVAMLGSALVHRVCVTTCLLFSCAFLYFMNQISSAKYHATPAASVVSKKK